MVGNLSIWLNLNSRWFCILRKFMPEVRPLLPDYCFTHEGCSKHHIFPTYFYSEKKRNFTLVKDDRVSKSDPLPYYSRLRFLFLNNAFCTMIDSIQRLFIKDLLKYWGKGHLKQSTSAFVLSNQPIKGKRSLCTDNSTPP